MPRAPRARLEDMLQALRDPEEGIAGFSFEEYSRTTMVKLATERCLEIISEASRFVPAELKARHAHIPWVDVAAIGNILRHEYHRTDDRIIWTIVQDHAVPLRHAVESMLNALDAMDRS